MDKQSLSPPTRQNAPTKPMISVNLSSRRQRIAQALQHDAVKLAAERRAARIASIVPESYHGVSFESFGKLSLSGNQPAALTAMIEYTKTGLLMDKNCVFLSGRPARGKTGLAMCALQCALQNGRNAEYIRWLDYIKQIQRTYKTEDDPNVIIDKYANAEWLFLDDLGIETMAGMHDNKIEHTEELIERRRLANLPTVVTSNLELSQVHSQFSERVASRFKERYFILAITGNDLRK